MLSHHSTREPLIAEFLIRCGLGGAERFPLKGDASFRRYERIIGNNSHWILMDAPPPMEDVRPYIHVTNLLRSYDLSAPAVIKEDAENGLLLLEDLGDDLYSRLLAKSPGEEKTLYLSAVDSLLYLQRTARDGQPVLPLYDEAALLREAGLLADWFLPQIMDNNGASAAKKEWFAIWQDLLAENPLHCNVPVLRDYHADNLIWLPERENTRRVGLLDYQDALWGDSAYDLVSLLEDARRDVSPETVELALEHFLVNSQEPRDGFMRRYAMLGAQRNSKIIGIFTRLYVRDGKSAYLNWLPRVWRLLEQDVQHPVLQPVRQWLDTYVPAEARGVLTADRSIQALA